MRIIRVSIRDSISCDDSSALVSKIYVIVFDPVLCADKSSVYCERVFHNLRMVRTQITSNNSNS